MMSHGGHGGLLYSYDSVFLVDELWNQFIGDKCPSLVGKPKLFFIQACRGDQVDHGVLLKDESLESLSNKSGFTGEPAFKIPAMADFLIMYSTVDGYYSFKSPTNGSWFIQALCDELLESPHEEIMTILVGVNRRVAFIMESYVPSRPEYDRAKQMPVIQSMLTKSFRFANK
jgi:caspase 7